MFAPLCCECHDNSHYILSTSTGVKANAMSLPRIVFRCIDPYTIAQYIFENYVYVASRVSEVFLTGVLGKGRASECGKRHIMSCQVCFHHLNTFLIVARSMVFLDNKQYLKKQPEQSFNIATI